MADHLNFHRFARSDLFDKATGTDAAHGRALVDIKLTLQDDLTGEHGDAPLHLALMGPGDVAGLQSSAVLRTAPKPWSRDNETTKLAHIDFADIDLPWRYSPDIGKPPQPWIVLITGTTDELELVNGAVKINKDSVLIAHDLTQATNWVHVQESGGRQVARLVSPRGLEPGNGPHAGLQPNQEYIAAVVPAFAFVDGQAVDAWQVAGQSLARRPDGNVLPAYYAWRFWTADAGDFETLAARLRAVEVGGLGRARLRYERSALGAELEIRGAITSLAANQVTQTAEVRSLPTTWPPDSAPAPAPVITDVDVLNQEFHSVRWTVIGLPVYGRPWIAQPEDTDWGRLLNGDPRFRGIAGLGTYLAIEAQEELVDEARKQVGALEEARQRVRQLALGLGAARSLWRRRLPADPLQQLYLFGPTLRRIPAKDGNTDRFSVMELVTGGARTLPRALLSSAARRMLRPGDGVTKHAQPGAAHRSALMQEANNCRPLPGRSAAHMDGVLEGAGLRGLLELLNTEDLPPEVEEVIKEVESRGEPIQSSDVAERLFGALRQAFGDRLPANLFDLLKDRLAPQNGKVVTRQILEDAVRPFLSDFAGLNEGREDPPGLIIELIDGMGPPLQRPCLPVRLGDLAGRVASAIDPSGPNAPALARVRATIEGIDISTLEPPEVCIGLNYEVWKLLRDKAKAWLLPGIEDLEKDAVVAMESNPAFVDALLVGLNTQFLGELHWRNMAVAATCTPLRWFWGNFDHKTDLRADDIRGIDLWQNTRLGDNQHQAQQADNRDLVMVFRTDLFRRYPHTLVYLVLANDDNALKLEQPNFDNGSAIGPKVKGSIGDDVTFFIFDVDPSKLADYRVVLDEPPAELRFRNDQNPVSANSATFAKSTIDTPTRVAIEGTYLQWKGLPQ